jgi:cobalt-zinc-cadmium resistance protein CzcA
MSKLLLLFLLAFTFVRLYGQAENNKLSLNDAIEIGIKQNPELLESAENINAAKGRFWSGISLPQPELEFIYEYAPINSSLNNYSERTFAISQSFEFPTNYFLKGSKYSKEEESAYQKFILKEKEVITEIRTAYNKVLAKQSLLMYAEEYLVISEDFFKKAQIRFNVGEGTNIEQLTAKVQLSEAKNKLSIAKNEIVNAFAELNYALGYGKQNYESNYILTDSLIYVEHSISINELHRELEETNPHIKIAEIQSGISSVEKNLAWSSLLPNFNLAYFKQSRDGDNGFYGASFGVSLPLWFLLDQRGSIQEAAANVSISDALLVQTKNEMNLRLKSAYIDHTNNRQQLMTYVEDILPQAEEAYRSAVKSYDAGELSYIEYMQVKQLLINARENYITALFNYNQTIIILEEIVGKNLNELEN